MKIKMVAVLAVTVSALFAATGALAQNRAGAITLTPSIGGYVFEDDQHLDEHRLTLGLAAGYNIDEHIGVEGVFNYIDGRSTNNRGDVDGFIFKVDGLYHFGPYFEKLYPYAAAGVGLILLDPERGGSDTDPLVNWGGGVKYYLVDFLALRGDIRHVIPFNSTHHNLMYTFGVTYLFGGKTAAAAPASPPMDSDHDGVNDDRDRCPDTPAGVRVDRDGCPLDSDNDGVADYLDKCPGTPANVRVGTDGCPLDSDKDGVPDYLDQCPDTPFMVKVDEKGCTAPLMEELCITLNVEFDFDKADVKPKYHDELAKVAECIKEYADNRISLEAHTDSKGTEEYNIGLSQRRAESVTRYLVDNFGVNATRITSKGFGESMPIADNETEEGRQRNRRVEVHIKPLGE